MSTTVSPFNFTEQPPPPQQKATTTESCPKRCLSCFVTRPKYGGSMILVDLCLLFFVMIQSYDLFFIEKQAQIQTAVRKIGHDGLDAVENADTFYKWMSTSLIPDSMATQFDTNGNHMFDPTKHVQMMYGVPIMISSTKLLQERRNKHALCLKKKALEQDSVTINTLIFLGVDCSDETADAFPFGHVVDVNGTVNKKCPHDFSTQLVLSQPPVQQYPFELQEYTIPDPIDPTITLTKEAYFLAANNPEFIPRLRDCGWIDTRTMNIVVVSSMMVPGHLTFGELRTRFKFSEFGNVIEIKRSVRLMSLSQALLMQEASFEDDFIYSLASSLSVPLYLLKCWFMLCGIVHGTRQGCKRVSDLSTKKRKDAPNKYRYCNGFRVSVSSFFKLSMLLDIIFIFQTVNYMYDSTSLRNINARALRTTNEAGAAIRSTNAKVSSPAWLMAWSKYQQITAQLMSEGMLAVQMVKNCCASFAVILFIELMRHFSNNKRLAIVPRSLAISAADIGHLLIVLFSITLSFAIILSVWYGEQFSQFSTIKSTMIHLILMNMGEWR